MFGSLLQLGAGLLTGGWSLIAQGALVVYGVTEARRQAKRSRQAREASYRDRTVTVRSSNAPARIIYGRARVGGVLVAPPWTHGDDRRFMTAVIALANHEVEAIEDILIDGESIGALAPDGMVQSGSPYFWTRREAISHPLTAAPASGGTITLQYTPAKIETVAYEATDSVTVYLQAGTGYTLSGRVVTITTDAAQGRPLTITYQYTPAQRSTYTDADFDGSSATLPHTAVRVLQVTYRYFPADDPGVTEGSTRVLVADTDYTWSGDTIAITGDANLQASPSGDPQLQVVYEHEQAGVGLVRVRKFLGTAAGERDPDLEVASGGEWTSAHLGKGIARIHVTLQWDEDYFPGGMPDISAIVKGKKVYDPRSEETTWSDNPALCIADYQTSDLGWNMPSADVDWDSVAEAADDCDELVDYDASNQHERYRIDGVVYCDAGLRENRDAMATTIGGWAGMTGGKFVIRAAKDREPTVGLVDADLAGPFEVQVDTPLRDLFNSVRGQFIDPDDGYQPTDFPPYPQDDEHPYIAADGARFWRDFDFPFTSNVYRAQRLAKLRLYRARQPLQDISVWTAAAAVLQPMDTVNFARAMLGWSPSKRFLVHDWRLDPATMTVQMTVQEDVSDVYAVDYDEYATPDPSPNTTLPSPRAVPALTNVVAQSGAAYFDVLPDGSIDPYVRFRWDAVTASGVLKGGYVEILYKRALNPEWDRIKVQPYETEYRLKGIRRGDGINWQLRAVNGLEVRSEAVIGTHVVDSGTPTAGQPVRGGNLLRNAGLSWPMYGWQWTSFGGGGTGELQRPAAAKRISGPYRNVVQWVDGTYPSGPGQISQTIDLPTARRFSTYADAWVRDCTAYIEVMGERRIGTNLWSECLRWESNAIDADDCGDDPQAIASYARIATVLDLDNLAALNETGRILVSTGQTPERLTISLARGPKAGGSETDSEAHWTRPMVAELAAGVSDHPPWSAGDANQPVFSASASGTTEQTISTTAGVTKKDDLGQVSIRGGGHLFIRLEARVRMTSVSAHAAFAELGWSPNLTAGAGVASGRIATMPTASGSGVVYGTSGWYEKDLGIVSEGTHTYRIAAISRPDSSNGATTPATLVIEQWQATLYLREPA